MYIDYNAEDSCEKTPHGEKCFRIEGVGNEK